MKINIQIYIKAEPFLDKIQLINDYMDIHAERNTSMDV
ncbi:hypothetical protein KIS4809_4489 [Bacillus sp. ZZV12-4809]|nr:hypothetical protein KIS4809_4489 [Bacillus sp. ZZV12-4809]